MPANARVTLCYGPYESSGVIQHRTFRLQGLQALRARGHLCVLEETREWNIVELVVSGEVVFTCNIKNLEFGDGKLDPVCREAVAAVESAY
uniref:Chromosome 10 open reading frame 53 n=1 Tax=Neolamprologus brichardi TaxID=32507 RepID=A0A3Q4HQ25_NEOBR